MLCLQSPQSSIITPTALVAINVHWHLMESCSLGYAWGPLFWGSLRLLCPCITGQRQTSSQKVSRWSYSLKQEASLSSGPVVGKAALIISESPWWSFFLFFFWRIKHICCQIGLKYSSVKSQKLWSLSLFHSICVLWFKMVVCLLV